MGTWTPFRLLLVCGVSSLAAFLPSPAHAVAVYPCSLLDLCDRAGIIVRGTCMAVRDGRDFRTRFPIRTVTLQTGEILKSRDPAVTMPLVGGRRLHTFRQYNCLSLYGCDAEPPGYAPGEDVLLFLAPTSKIGLTAPIGMWQGKFRVIRTGTVRRPSYLVANLGNNSNLSINGPLLQSVGPGPRSMQSRRIDGLGLTGWDRTMLTRPESGPVDLSRFLALIRRIVRSGSRR